jgi:CubicO group peptidase (beta-lactamase class C family)
MLKPTEESGNADLNSITIFSYFDDAGLDSMITAIMSSNSIPGVSACIIDDGKIEWEGYYGYSDIETNTQVTDSTLFLLASISKTITATAIMQLWEEGLFNLNDNINDYLPDDLQVVNPNFPDDIITFKMLLTHTSSLNDDWYVLYDLKVEGDSPVSLYNFLINYLVPGGSYYDSVFTYNSWSPGTILDYSNVGFALLGYLVEVIADTSFPGYCKKNIFQPLQMNHTGWLLSEVEENLLATPYNPYYYPYQQYGIPWYPAGTLRASAIALANFLIAYMQMGQFGDIKILDSTTVHLMTSVQNPNVSEIWGLGWIIDDIEFYLTGLPGKIYYGHDGSSYGFETAMYYNVDDKKGIIVLTNGDDYYAMYDIWYVINKYAYYYDQIYAFDTKVNNLFLHPDDDTLLIKTKFVNTENHDFSSNLIYTSIDSAIVDSIPLFDDGNHNDGYEDDGIWGNQIESIAEENEFFISISTTDLSDGTYFKSLELERFTTIGPVVFKGYEITYQLGSIIILRLYLKNEGQIATAAGITAELTTADTSNVIKITTGTQDAIDIPASQTLKTNQTFTVSTVGSPDTLYFDVKIFSNGYHFWTDSSVATFIEQVGQELPKKFSLSQNYPNPMNPSTTIEISLPKTEFTTLKIYNTLGQEIITLISDKLNAGFHKYQWNASGIASGIYYYRLVAGEYTDTKKLVVLK